MYASMSGHEEIIKLLLEKGADVNDKDIMGHTALAHVGIKLQEIGNEIKEKYLDIAHILIQEMKKSLTNLLFIPTDVKDGKITKKSKISQLNYEYEKVIKDSIESFNFLLSIPKGLLSEVIKHLK